MCPHQKHTHTHTHKFQPYYYQQPWRSSFGMKCAVSTNVFSHHIYIQRCATVVCVSERVNELHMRPTPHSRTNKHRRQNVMCTRNSESKLIRLLLLLNTSPAFANKHATKSARQSAFIIARHLLLLRCVAPRIETATQRAVAAVLLVAVIVKCICALSFKYVR